MKNKNRKLPLLVCILALTIICTFFSAFAEETVCMHTSTHHVVEAATCGTNGYDRVVCDLCNVIIKETLIQANGHSYGEWTVITNPTHMTSGLRRRACSACSTVETDIIPRLYDAHEFVFEELAHPDCEKQGVIEYTCSLCNYKYTQAVEALGHLITERTDNGDGTYTGPCERCGQVFTIDYQTGKPVVSIEVKPEPEKEKGAFSQLLEWLEKLYIWINSFVKNMKDIIAMI